MSSSLTSPLAIAALVLGILAVHAVLLVLALRWAKRATLRVYDAVHAELAASGEPVVLTPSPGVYRGSSGGLPKARGNCIVALTERRLIVRRLVGEAIELPTADITGAREEKWFLGGRTGDTHVVVETRGRGELGLFVRDRAKWLAALRRVASR